jgi:glycosyltransferase involved in cell wall biosynthesis
MNVSHLITTIERGGAETQLLTLVLEQVRQGKKVKIIYLKGVPSLKEEFIVAGAEVVERLANRSPIIQYFELKKIYLSEPQVVHCHLPRAELLAALTNCIPFVVSRHNAEKFFPSAPRGISSFLSRFVLRKAAACIAISAAVKDFLLKQSEVPSGTVVNVVHYGINESRFTRENDRQYDEKAIKLGTISRLVPQKNLKMLLFGFQSLYRSHPESTLKIVGKGLLERELKELAQDIGIGSQVSWESETSNVPKFFGEIDIFCLTSNYEGFGLVLLESMACGVPIICKANPATIEVLGEDYEFLLWSDGPEDFSNAVTKLSSEVELAKIRQRNFKRLDYFTASRMENKISNLYLTLSQQ